MLDVVLMSVALIALAAASYQDLHMREVANWISFGLIFSALGIRTMFGLNALLTGLVGLGIFFLVALFFYATDQWGGGDSKILMGLGAVIGFNIFQPDFSMALYFTYVLVIGAFFGLFWSIGVAITNRTQFLPSFSNLLKANRGWHIASGVSSLVLFAGSFFLVAMLPLAIFPVAGFYLLTFVKSVEGSCFHKKIDPSSLVEGDWLAEDVVYRRKVVVPQGTLDKHMIFKLRQLKSKGVTSVLVKEGIPFVPSFLIGYVVFLVFNVSVVLSWL